MTASRKRQTARKSTPVLHFNYQVRPMKNSTGFTLIEVLVTMVIMAIGLLGLAGLQAASLKKKS